MPVYRLSIPGYRPVTFTDGAAALAFARFAVAPIAGRGLTIRLWRGRRVDNCDVYSIAPFNIAI
jgi:hypothetical protein